MKAQERKLKQARIPAVREGRLRGETSMVKKREFTYDSGDGKAKIHAIAWSPEERPILGVLQIIHGMVEHIDRYDEFARFLAEHGIVVVGNDHLGHGTTAESKEDYGFFHEIDGNQIVLKDIHQLKKLTCAQYPKVPYFMLGHSMGSFLVRQYLCLLGSGIDGAVIMGTGNPSMASLRFGKALCWVLGKIFGQHHRSRLIDAVIFGGYQKKFQPCRTPYDWHTKDTKLVDAYAADERCTFRFTVNGYFNLFTSIEGASAQENLQRMPKKLPILFASGWEDPVGNFGKGVEEVRLRFKEVGMEDLTWILYENDRHEILNETDRDKVYQDIYAWLYVRIQDLTGLRSVQRL